MAACRFENRAQDARKRMHVMVAIDVRGRTAEVGFEALELRPELGADLSRGCSVMGARIQPPERAVVIEELAQRPGGADRPAEGENEMQPDGERIMLARPRKRRVRRRRVDHERCRGDDPLLVRFDDAGDDTGSEAEVVGGHDELFHKRPIVSRIGRI